MELPAVTFERDRLSGLAAALLRRRRSFQGLVNTELVVVGPELLELSFQVHPVPEKHAVQVLSLIHI